MGKEAIFLIYDSGSVRSNPWFKITVSVSANKF